MTERNLATEDPDILRTPRGVVDLSTGRWESSDLLPDQPCTAVDPSDDPSACPRWLAFLAEISGEITEAADRLGRFMGYSLSGHVSKQCMLSLHGGPATGKTTLLDIWTHILGGYAMRSDLRTVGSDHRSLAQFEGKRLVCTTDGLIADDAPWALKALTSGDPVSAIHDRTGFFSYIPQCKIAVAHDMPQQGAAGWPHISHMAAARSLITVETYCAPHAPDENLGAALRSEASSILRWMIDEHLQWRESGFGLRADALQPGHRVVCHDGETRSIHRICTLRDDLGSIEVTFTDTRKSVYEPDEIIMLDRRKPPMNAENGTPSDEEHADEEMAELQDAVTGVLTRWQSDSAAERAGQERQEKLAVVFAESALQMSAGKGTPRDVAGALREAAEAIETALLEHEYHDDDEF